MIWRAVSRQELVHARHLADVYGSAQSHNGTFSGVSSPKRIGHGNSWAFSTPMHYTGCVPVVGNLCWNDQNSLTNKEIHVPAMVSQ